ncbi:MAG TPA: hypothetical protein VI588_00795 [Candidatus Gracilibacteria bacterium]|nr:hypothetical protein [Candidatus Gracilibacteria bacterium]
MRNIQLPRFSDKEIMGLLAFYLARRHRQSPAAARKAPVWQLEMAVKNLGLQRIAGFAVRSLY